MKDTMPPAEVRRVRELYGMTQEEFADFLGLKGAWRVRTVKSYESGRVKVHGGRKAQIELLRERRTTKLRRIVEGK